MSHKKSGGILPFVAGAYLAAGVGIVHTMYKNVYIPVRPERGTTDQLTWEDRKEAYPRREFSFISGSSRLRGYIYNENDTGDMIVFSHGIHSTHESYFGAIRALVDRGWMVVAFDNTGAGKSEGKSGIGLCRGPLDLHAALSYIEADPVLSKKRKFLIGHSQGGYSVGAVLNFNHKVAGAVSMSGFDTPFDIEMEYGIRDFGTPAYLLTPFLVGAEIRRFGCYWHLSAVRGINRRRIPVLITHTRKDNMVDYYGASLLSKRKMITNPNVSYMTLSYPEREDHENFFYSLEAGRIVVSNWEKMNVLLKRYKKRHPVELPVDVCRAFYAKTDKEAASEYNADLWNRIDEYLRGLM